MDSVTLTALLASQSTLVQEAAEALPHAFSTCTYPLGHIRQAVYLCRTCHLRRGICSACSVACHTHHDQLELFPKRRFRCDCPTAPLAHACTLHPTPEDENTENTYGQNFDGVFCRCGRAYDALNETETMIQCLACEDWYHESCLNLRERPPSPDGAASERDVPEPTDDARSDASSSGLPPPLLTAADYDSLVCASCVRTIDTLRRYAGTPGVLMVVRPAAHEPWRVLGRPADDPEDVDVDVDVGPRAKRARSSSLADAPQAKRVRADRPGPSSSREGPTQACLAPSPDPAAQRVLQAGSEGEGAGDVFLTDGFRTRWCRCDQCLPSLQAHPYLLTEEETYEPPEDPDSGVSLEELGMRALQRIPRERAINGIHAFNEMRDQLMKHLRPIAAQDREVTAADIHAFFEEARQAQAERARRH